VRKGLKISRSTEDAAARYFRVDGVDWKIEECGPDCTVQPAKTMAGNLPSLVIVGRPNVGKSTLFNRLTGTRRAIVTDEPGITRDRMYGKTEWNGRVLEVVDTGGLVPDDKALIPSEIFRQASVAIKNASLLVLVVDSHAGLTPLDEGPGLMPTQGQVPSTSSRLHLRAGNQRRSMRMTFNCAARGSSRVT